MIHKITAFALVFIFTNIFAQQQDFQVLFNSKDIKNGCYRIPSLITAKDGTLIAAADERIEGCGDLIYNKDINIVIRTSSDGGKNWSAIRKIIDFPNGQSASDPSMVTDERSGKIYLFYNYMDLINAPKVFRMHVVTSMDSGKTWSKPQDITPQIAGDTAEKDFKFITSGRAFQMADGRIINTLVNVGKGVKVFGTKDSGATWQTISESLKPADESLVTEIDNSQILVNSRVNSYGKRRFHILGSNGALNASHDVPELVDPGCNASILKIKKGRKYVYLFSNLNDPKQRVNLEIRTSKDFCQTWDGNFSVYKGSAAYSSMTQINRKKVGILFEKDDYSQIVFRDYLLKDILKK